MKPNDPDRLRVRVVRTDTGRRPAFCVRLTADNGFDFRIDTTGDYSTRVARMYAKCLRHALRKHNASVRAAALRRGR